MTDPRRRYTLLAFVVVLGACTPGGTATTTTTTRIPTTTTTTEGLPDLPPASVTTTSLPPGVDAATAAAMRARVDQLLDITEDLRALEFLERPVIRIVDDAAIAQILEPAMAMLGDPAFDVDLRLQQVLGMVPGGFRPRRLYTSYYDELPVAVFDEPSGALYVAVRAGGLSALEESVVVREIVRALASEYFAVATDVAGTVPASFDDRTLAVAALVEGDATYFQFLYLQTLDPDQQAQAALEAAELAWQPPPGTPTWVVERLAFPYDDGLVFVSRLVAGGGIAALDRAYADPPASSEQILHPERYLGGEAVLAVAELEIDVAGYREHSAGQFGELAWRALLSSTLDAGLLTQTADGWAGDTYVSVFSAGEIGIVLRVATDSTEDGIEYAEALIAHARDTLAAGDGADVDGGILFDEGGPYVFIDRRETELLVVIASSSSLGSALKEDARSS